MTDFENTYASDVWPEFEAVQRTLDSFVAINYETAVDACRRHGGITEQGVNYQKQQMLDILAGNPPLASIPAYVTGGKENYLWYSDFYDDITKECFIKYRKFTPPDTPITPANYAERLAKIDFPYFKELVRLVSLMKHIEYIEERLPKTCEDLSPEKVEMTIDAEYKKALEPLQTEIPKSEEPKPKRSVVKRSYEPRMNDKQYSLLAECMKSIRLFRRPVSVAKLKKLFKGRLPEPLQVTNQKSLVYLFDLLKEQGYIKETWISVADGNGDFISFLRGKNRERFSSEGNNISGAQFSSRRIEAKSEYIHGLDIIEDTVESMAECGDK